MGQYSREEDTIHSAFATFRTQPEVMIAIDGTDQLGSRTNVIYSNAFFKWDPAQPNSFAKTELNEYLNGARMKRIVGDGMTLWSYDFAKNTYSASRYGSYGAAQPQGFRASMLFELTNATSGPSVFLARTLREIFSGDFAQYRSWFPMAQITVVSDVAPTRSMVDPIVPSRSYTGDQLNFYVVYTYNPRVRRSGAFHFSRSDVTKPWTLAEVFYADGTSLNASTPRLVDWRMTFHTGMLPASTNYVFVPPTNARAIANARSRSGG